MAVKAAKVQAANVRPAGAAMDAQSKIAMIRLLATFNRPYFATALFSLHIVAEPQVETMSIDQYGRVYVNPARLGGKTAQDGKWTIEEASWVLVHELQHWLRQHHERTEPYTAQASSPEEKVAIARLANIAQDLAINGDLLGEKTRGSFGAAPQHVKLPDEGIWPSKYGLPDGKLWEEYYELLLKEARNAGVGKMSQDDCDCGSGAHGMPRDYELPAPGGRTPGLTEAEGKLVRQRTAREIRAHDAQHPGTIAAGLRRWADSVLEPPVIPWERELSALVKNACTMARGAVDYSYTKISRRGMFSGVLMPALVRPEPDAAVVLDTSGSMDQALLVAALREIQGILRAVGQRKVPVLCCDANVHGGVQRVSSAFQIALAGGGGTDMGVGIAAAQKLRSNVIIVLTDGFTPWPAVAPRGCQLVVGILEPNQAWEKAYPAPSYAKRVLRIRDPKGQKAA